MPQSRAVGIDLGTTRSRLAQVDATGHSGMIRSAQGDALVPSVVFFEDDEPVFGRAAKQSAAAQPSRAAEFFKRDLGQPSYSRAIGGELVPAELMESYLLAALTEDLAADGGPRPAVVLSHPGCFDQAQRGALVDAARIAGVDLLGTIHDPLAVALLFAESQGYLSPAGGERPKCRALVFDLGGGKLDVAIIEIKSEGLRTRAVGGDARLGARDWDMRLADHLAEEFAKQFGEDPRFDMASVRRLLENAEEAKHTLSARQQARVRVERGTNSLDVTVTRQTFENLTAELVERAGKVTEQVLAQASMAWRDLTHLLLVGGASRMPMIAKMLETLTWLKPAPNVHADEAVARGAAVYAEHLLARRERRAASLRVAITDVAAHSLGLEWHDPAKGKVENVVLIARGSELPSVTTSKVTTQADDQTSITLALVEGESRNAQECTPIGQLTLSELPQGLPRYWPIDVIYQVTSEGRLDVKAQMQKTNQAVKVTMARNNGMTDAQLAACKRLVAGHAGLKAIHAELAQLATQASAAAQAPQPAAGAAAPQSGAVPPPIPPLPHRDPEDFELESHYSAVSRVRRNKNAQRRLMINVAGYIVFSLLGLAIGYYIVMIFRPEWNVYHLRLPGLRPPTAGSQAPFGEPH